MSTKNRQTNRQQQMCEWLLWETEKNIAFLFSIISILSITSPYHIPATALSLLFRIVCVCGDDHIIGYTRQEEEIWPCDQGVTPCDLFHSHPHSPIVLMCTNILPLQQISRDMCMFFFFEYFNSRGRLVVPIAWLWPYNQGGTEFSLPFSQGS